jgi:hypothetical protein
VQLHMEGDVQSPFMNGQGNLSNLDATVKAHSMTLINVGPPEGTWRMHLDDTGANPTFPVRDSDTGITLVAEVTCTWKVVPTEGIQVFHGPVDPVERYLPPPGDVDPADFGRTSGDSDTESEKGSRRSSSPESSEKGSV